MIEVKDNLNRPIFVIENAATQSQHEAFYAFVIKSFYQIGFTDTVGIETAKHKYFHSEYSIDDYMNSGFHSILENTKLYSQIKNQIKNGNFRININLSTPTNIYFPHTHTNEWAIIYYANLDWKHEWAGETLFYSDDLNEIVHGSIYKPRKLIFFDGEIPHTIRPQSIEAPQYRFTVAMFVPKE